MAKKKQPEVGSLYSIKLPDNNYAFGRVMQDGGFQVFDYQSKEQDLEPISESDISFTVSMYFDAYLDERMDKIGKIAFNNDDESWPPKSYIFNPVTESYSIYHKGKIEAAEKSDCTGLESTSAWELDHVIDRIMGDMRWVNRIEE